MELNEVYSIEPTAINYNIQDKHNDQQYCQTWSAISTAIVTSRSSEKWTLLSLLPRATPGHLTKTFAPMPGI